MYIDILNFIKPNTSLSQFVQEYATLSLQLANVEHQSFYFKRGLEANQKRLTTLKASYNSKRQYINSHSLDAMIQQKREKEEKLNSTDWYSMGMITRIARSGLLSDIAFLEDCIEIKSLFPWLPEVEEIIEDF